MAALRLLLWRLGLLLALAASSHQQQPYDDFTWVQEFAIVGDSYTAGIGAGSLLNYDCSRYDGSYAVMMSKQFAGLKNVYNKACSGAQTPDIMTQIQSLPGNLDLAVITAGGNDLCLSDILKRCIFSHVASTAGCNSAIQGAQNMLNSYFEANVQTLLEALAGKMKSSGVIILVGYAQFFDATTDACTREEWTLLGPTSLPLSTSLRAALNDLVVQTNAALFSAVEKAEKSTGAKIGFADWDLWPKITHGRFCEQGQNANPWASGGACGAAGCNTGGLQFYKLNTTPVPQPFGGLYRRHEEKRQEIAAAHEEEWAQVRNETVLSSMPLSLRGITQANCPDSSASTLIPDSIGKLFHPTILGHTAMMTFAMDEIRAARAVQLGIPGPGCTLDEATSCAVPSGSYAPYSTWFAIQDQIPAFCSSVASIINAGTGTVPFAWTGRYYRGTPDDVEYTVQFDLSVPPAAYWNADDCVTNFKKAMVQCWERNSPASNPLQWVYGGTYTSGHWKYTIAPQSNTRVWPPPTEPRAKIAGHINTQYGETSFLVKGAGWASWDRGLTTLQPNFTFCDSGHLPLQWSFKYYPTPSADGFEWEAFVQAGQNGNTINCMASGWVTRYSGGPDQVNIDWSVELPASSWANVCPSLGSDSDVSSLTCVNNCCGYIICPAWCNAQCGGVVCGRP